MSRSYLYYFVNFLVCQWILMTCVWVVGADVLVISRSSNFTVNIFPDLPANFGQILPYEGIRGCVVTANPPHACEAIDPPPTNSNCSDKWFVLIRRFECNFVDKVRAAQNAEYDAAIIYNVGSNLIGNNITDLFLYALKYLIPSQFYFPVLFNFRAYGWRRCR